MLTRELYRKIKNMNRGEMEEYLNEFHAQAYNSGISDMAKKIAEKVDAGIRNTPGIGEKRYAELISSINAELTKDDKKEDEETDKKSK